MELNRRQLLQAAASATSASLVAGGAALIALPSVARPAQALRPPGALAEEQFLGACIRCGLCVRDCPPQNLKLSSWGDALTKDWATSVAVGTPYFEARKIPCEMCEDVPCVKACPTGALDPKLTDITQIAQAQAVELAQIKERLASAESALRLSEERHQAEHTRANEARDKASRLEGQVEALEKLLTSKS